MNDADVFGAAPPPEMSDADVFGAPKKTGIVDDLEAGAKAQGALLKQSAKGAWEGLGEGTKEAIKDFTTPVDTESYKPSGHGLAAKALEAAVPGLADMPGAAEELLEPVAPAIGDIAGLGARAGKIAMEIPNAVGAGLAGATKPYVEPIAEAAAKTLGASPETAQNVGESANAAISQIPLLAMGGLHGTPETPTMPKGPADVTLDNIAQGKPVGTTETPPAEPTPQAATPEPQKAAPLPVEQPAQPAPPAAPEGKAAYSPQFDLQTNAYHVAGPEGRVGPPTGYARPEQAEAAAAELNAAAPAVEQPQSSPTAAVEPPEAPAPATPPVDRRATLLAPVPPHNAPTLMQWVRSNGGIKDTGGDVAQMFEDNGKRPPPGIIANQTGQAADVLAQRAREAGYFPDVVDDQGRPDELTGGHLLDAIQDEINGTPRFSENDREAVEAHEGAKAYNDNIKNLSGLHGVDFRGTTADAFHAAVSHSEMKMRADNLGIPLKGDETPATVAAMVHEKEIGQAPPEQYPALADAIDRHLDARFGSDLPDALDDLPWADENAHAAAKAGVPPEEASGPGEGVAGSENPGTAAGERQAVGALGEGRDPDDGADIGADRLQEPAVERTDQGDQYVMPGAERSAQQMAAARGETITSKVPQKAADDGLFAPAETEQPGLFGEPGEGYGAKNTLVTLEAAEGARDVLRKAMDGTRLMSGIDPETIAAGIKLAAYHIEAGARTFADFSARMIADMGEAVKPYLRDWFDNAQKELSARAEKPESDEVFGAKLPEGASKAKAAEARDLFDTASTAMENGKGPLKYPVNLIRTVGQVVNDSMLGRTVRRVVSPGAFDDTARLAARGIRQVFGQMYVRDLQTAHALQSAVDMLDQMTPEDRTAFAIAMDEGKKQPTPELQAIADNVKQQTDAATKRLQSLDVLQDAKENYLGRIWKPRGEAVDDTTTNKVLARLTAKRPLTGGKSFLKQRVHDTYREAIDSGLEPVFNNPITTQLVKLSEMNRFYAGTLIARAAKQSGFAKFMRNGEDHGDLVELEGPEFHRQTRTIDHADGTTTSVPEGAWFAPEGYARVYNNYVSKGLEGTDLAEPAKWLRGASNAMNSFQLGLSAFHPVFTSIDGQISRVGIGIDQAMRGQFGKGASNFIRGLIPLNWRGNFVEGDNLLKAILDPKNATPEMQRIVDAFGAGGGRAFMQRVLRPTDEGAIKFWKSGAFGRAMQDAANKYPGSPVRQMLNVTGRALESTAAPVMDYIVPRQKLGVFSRLASDWLQSHPDASNTEFVAAMQDRWESVDNRLGQMVYDNLFWNKTLKDIAFITTRSVGWNMGSIREIGGGAADFGKYALDAAGGRSPDWTHRMSYIIALPTVTAMYGAMLQYMFTGHGPQELKDYFYPKTGLKRADGSADRVSIPTYMKDVFAYANDPGQTLMNKANPFLSFLDQLKTGKDYYGDLIGNKDDPYYKQIGDVLGFAAKSFEPFSIQGTKRLFQERPGPSAALGMFGVTPAPGYITNPAVGQKYEDKAHRALVKKTAKHQYKEQNVQPLKPMNPQNP